ncbi:hypothetical protein [Anaerosporobacter sp.]|uniref:hypothetical protein n=1 Tax=Anaerosporobacter sp. TaxID=1872529 RepID=UPI00286ED583|nr:hypothetical protein [Anaerosporobacter sp.]
MKKNIISIIMCCILIGTTHQPINAQKAPLVQSEIYEEKGQIILDSVSLTNNDGAVGISNTTNLIQAKQISQQLQDPQIQSVLSDYMENDRTPIGIGWTRVYFDGEGDTIDDVPMTVNEMEEYKKSNFVKAMVQGKSTTYGYNFTLYTIVGYDNWNPSITYADSVAEWSLGSAGKNGPSYTDDDFITMSWPKGFVLLTSGLSGGTNQYKKKEAYSSVVWGFEEKVGKTILMTTGKNDNSSVTRKWVSDYVHTWGETTPSFEISLSGISVSLSSSSMSWQVASSLVY